MMVGLKILPQNWLPWQRPLSDGKRGSDLKSATKYLTFGEKSVKIGPVNPEIIDLREIIKKHRQNTNIAVSAGMPSWLNYSGL